MKMKVFGEIDGYKIITGVQNAAIDPEKTKKRAEDFILKHPEILGNKTRDDIYGENIVFSEPDYGENIDDTEAQKLQSLISALGPKELLLCSGEKITDHRGLAYWMQESGKWQEQKIEKLGETLPPNAVVNEELSVTQREEIMMQKETERVLMLTPEQKAEEKEAALAAVKREVRNLKEEAEIAGEDFDARAEFILRKAKIVQKYG